jgi:predicted membrane protein
METRHNSFFAPRLVLGLGIIIIGVLFLLGNMDIIDPHEYLRLWPAILIVVGIAYLIQCQHGSGRVWGIILTFVGTAMLLDRLYFIHFSLWDYWPLILIFIGMMMIVKSLFSRRGITPPFAENSFFRRGITPPFAESSDANNYIKAIAVLGGFKRINNSKNFKGGEFTAIMGGLEIDLRDASIEGEAVIDIFALMGGVEMRVPEDWLVIIEGFPFMGGFEDKTRPPKESAKHLIIKGTAVMGGVEIKN